MGRSFHLRAPRQPGRAAGEVGLLALFLATVVAAPVRADQTYRVEYRYRLTNPTGRSAKNVRVHIPIPTDCTHQEVRSFRIRAHGGGGRERTIVDQYAQRICQITLPEIAAGTTAEVGFEAEVTLHPGRRIPLDRERIGTLSDIPSSIREVYTTDVPSTYDLGSSAIQAKSAELVKGHANLFDRVMAIHDFVAGMRYVRDGRWDKASVVLERGTGSCSEFSYLFCALCRAAGIPTRFAGGTCCRLKRGQSWPVTDRVYHRWAEVYLPPYGWVPFDVTRDRGKRPKRDHVGCCPRNAFILTRGGSGSRLLGNQYIGSNSHYGLLKRERTFVWRPK